MALVVVQDREVGDARSLEERVPSGVRDAVGRALTVCVGMVGVAAEVMAETDEEDTRVVTGSLRWKVVTMWDRVERRDGVKLIRHCLTLLLCLTLLTQLLCCCTASLCFRSYYSRSRLLLP